ncbi:predicted protein [Chaetomium globosum CBS 148.51]|uniref:Uncharacterized protein n=1 Tax=Chaetomium globosum (strain ATCC 6205 / CBS 148.51 / DSM 1962 / NBRC 6347 / NRRL 1970) TaxID=306901 RepID=Q2H3J0_CHAGB|nr:uncharacterized protein CHGG_06775 [Chaetomium globosum CBS 148.51]EAQ90156.1 predicted protein [Chaetomium globosum CBS 148.51]
MLAWISRCYDDVIQFAVTGLRVGQVARAINEAENQPGPVHQSEPEVGHQLGAKHDPELDVKHDPKPKPQATEQLNAKHNSELHIKYDFELAVSTILSSALKHDPF